MTSIALDRAIVTRDFHRAHDLAECLARTLALVETGVGISKAIMDTRSLDGLAFPDERVADMREYALACRLIGILIEVKKLSNAEPPPDPARLAGGLVEISDIAGYVEDRIAHINEIWRMGMRHEPQAALAHAFGRLHFLAAQSGVLRLLKDVSRAGSEAQRAAAERLSALLGATE